MKISAFAQTCEGPLETHLGYIAEATEQSAAHGSKLLVLPGWSLGCEVRFYRSQIEENKRAFLDISTKHGVAIVAEIDHTYVFHPDGTITGPLVQQFASSRDKKAKYQSFAEEWNSGERFVPVENKTIGLMLCGENNYLTNIQSDNQRVEFRYPDLGWSDEYHILVNPTHRRMGNWGKLHKRFEYLSHDGRTVVHVANDDTKGGPPTTSTVCVYRDSSEVVDGNFKANDSDLYIRHPHWWLTTIETD